MTIQDDARRELLRRYQLELKAVQMRLMSHQAATDWPLVETDRQAWQNWAAAGLPGLPMRQQQAE